MLQEKKSKRGAWIALGCVAALLALVIVLENTMQPTSMLFTVLKKGAVYALVAASLNLLNGFTGLFSLGQAGFMLLGAYTYAILTIPSADRESVYYLYGGSAVNFSLPELFGGGALGLILGVLAALILAGCVAAVIAWLIGLPVLRLKSDYLAIATLGFAEIIRAIFQWDRLGPVTNGANALKSFPTFSSFNIENANGEVVLRLSTFVPFLLVAVCIGIMVLLINSTYGRAFKAIREDEVAAEAMGINLAKHKRMAFCISSFFAGVGGGLFAMFANQAQAKTFTTSMTYEILLIVVIGGMLLGLIAAVLCNKAFPGIRVFSTSYALPMAIASSSAAMIFQIMLHPAVGIVNKLLGLDINWLNDPKTALICVAILTAWLNSGINFLYFSAGLGNIDETIYERASVDGASSVQQFFSLTLPGLSPIMFYTLVVNIIQAFQSFGQIKILTEGGPNESTNVIVYSIYRDAFFNYRFGSAAAQSVILFIIIMIITLIMFRIEKKGVNY